MENNQSASPPSDLRQRLKSMTNSFQKQNAQKHIQEARLQLKVLKCLDQLETTIQYSNFSAV